MKKKLVTALFVSICLGITGCGASQNVANVDDTNNVQTVVDEAKQTNDDVTDASDSDNSKETIDLDDADKIGDADAHVTNSNNSAIFEYSIEYAGDEYQLPADLSEFLDNGWDIPAKKLEREVAPGERVDITLTRDDVKSNCFVANLSDETVTLDECYLIGIHASIKVCEVDMQIENGIYYGMSEEELVEILEPYDVELKEDGNLRMYTILDPTNEKNNYAFAVRDGVVDIISVYYWPDEL